MTSYAKLRNNQLEYAPRNYNGVSNWIYNEKDVLAAGYLPVEFHKMPVDGKKYRMEYEQLSDKIVQKWGEEIPTKEDIRAERQARYIAEADPLKLDYDEAVARGAENAEELKTAWLAKKDEIRADLPYPKEVDL